MPGPHYPPTTMANDRTTADAQSLFDRGHLSLQSGDFPEAVECFTRAIRLKPNIAAGYRFRALAYLELGQRIDALNDLDQAIRIRSDDPMLYADRARVLYRQRSFAAAIADCDRALNLDPGLAPLHGLRGECHAANGETNKAFADFAVAMEQDAPNIADYLIARAELHLELEDFEAALADADAAVERNPESSTAHQTRGMIHRALHHEDDAEADFTTTLKLDPDRVLARLARATVRLGLKRFPEALADCDTVIEALPGLPKGFEIRGMARKFSGDIAGALSDYNEAIRLNPGSLLAYNLRAGIHYQQQQYNKAIQDHLEALKRDPKSAGTFNQLGWIWATAPDPDIRNGTRAKECATRACELTEWQEAGYLDTLAAAHAELGDYEEAAKWMEKAIKLAPEHEDDYRTRLSLYESDKPYRGNSALNARQQ